VDEPVVEVDGMLQSQGPVLGGESSAIEESTSSDSELVVVDLYGTILGGAIGAGRFQDIPMLSKQ
jgi:hypothetical protein